MKAKFSPKENKSLTQDAAESMTKLRMMVRSHEMSYKLIIYHYLGVLFIKLGTKKFYNIGSWLKGFGFLKLP